MSGEEPEVDCARERQSHYAQGRSWAQERDAARRRSTRAAWIVAGVAMGIAALEGLALIALAPLKTIVPYTLLVDRNTGFVQVLDGTHPQTIKPDSALIQSLLAQYVIAREGYDVASVAEQYHKVSLWSAGAARQEYLSLMPATNPQSPLAHYGHQAQLVAQVESVSLLGQQGGAQGRALVRFTTRRRDFQGRGDSAPSYWVAVIVYRFVGDPAAIEDRLVNPLGFQIVAYRRDQEAPPMVDASSVSMAAPGENSTQPQITKSPEPARSTSVITSTPAVDRQSVPDPQNPVVPRVRPRLAPAPPWRAAQPATLQQRYTHPSITPQGGGEP